MGTADTQPLISIIVPIYKVEKYLSTCIDSILAQTYPNLEIILVDDGSPDNCPSICDEYAEKDSRIRVIHKENGGLSDARNAGLSIIRGEYLMFVDSDDVLPLHAVNTLYNLAIEHDAELAIGSYTRFTDNSEINADIHDTQNVHCLTKADAIQHMFQNGCASWGRLYRVDIHQNILFPIDEINEDEAIVLNILDRCNKVVITDVCVYQYRCRPGSITTTEFNPKKLIWAKHCKDNLAWIREHYPELSAYALNRYCGCLVWLLSELAKANRELQQSANILLKELKAEYPYFKKLPSLSNTTRTHMVLQKYLSFNLYSLLLRTWRKLQHG